MTDRESIFNAINDERKAQDEKWGDQSGHSDYYWTTILTEEVGEAAEAALDRDEAHLMIELTQCAAVCVQWMEALLKRYEPTHSSSETSGTLFQDS